MEYKTNIEHETGFLPSGFHTLRILGLPLGPRYTYQRIIKPGRAEDPISYLLRERDPDTDEIRNVDVVYSINEAETWLKNNNCK